MQDLQLGTAIALAYDENGTLGVQTDGHGEKTGVHGRYHVGMYGLISRPLDADANGGALVLYSDEGDEGFAWCGSDHRDLAVIPAASGGSSGTCNSLGAFLLQDYATETTTLYQPIANRTKAHKFLFGVDGNSKPTIDLMHSSGAYLTMTDDEVVLRHTGNALLKIKGDAVDVNGTLKVSSGIDIGGGVSINLTLATPLVSYLTALESLLVALSAALDAKLPASPGVSSGAVTAFVSSGAALKTALVSQLAKAL